ncbi:MAG: hypothetical protein R2877_06810 [Bdellovibrionota bacterium]
MYFTDEEKMVYSHIDLTGPENKYGRMKEGKVGYHLSENQNVNLARLLESVGEFDHSLALLELNHKLDNDLKVPSSIERIRQLDRLIQVSSKACDRVKSCQYYTELSKLIHEPEYLKSNLKNYCDTAKQ